MQNLIARKGNRSTVPMVGAKEWRSQLVGSRAVARCEKEDLGLCDEAGTDGKKHASDALDDPLEVAAISVLVEDSESA